MSSNQGPRAKSPEVPWSQPNGIYGTYDMHCHCGTIKYRMKISPPLYEEETEGKEQLVAVECHCSYCERNATISVHPLVKDVEFTQGLDDRVIYYTAAKKNPHWFCGKCGSVLGTDLTWLMANVFGMENRMTINLRMLKDFDRERLKIRQSTDMKHFGPKYEV